MMYENGMNPGVHLLGLYFKISDEHTLPHIFFWGSIPPPTTIPGMKSQTYLIEFSLRSKRFGKAFRTFDALFAFRFSLFALFAPPSRTFLRSPQFSRG